MTAAEVGLHIMKLKSLGCCNIPGGYSSLFYGGEIRGFRQVEMPANAIVPTGSIKQQRSFSHIFLSFCSAATLDTVSKHKVGEKKYHFFFNIAHFFFFSSFSGNL